MSSSALGPTAARHPPGSMPFRYDEDNVFLLVIGAALGVAMPWLGLVGVGDIVYVHPSWIAWLATAATAAALVPFFYFDPEINLPVWWRTLWTAAFLVFLVQQFCRTSPPGAFVADEPVRVGGVCAANILLAAFWAATVVLAWAKPAVTWPQAVLFLVLSGSLLWNMFASATPPSWICGGAFVAALVAAGFLRLHKLKEQLLAPQEKSEPGPKPPDLTITQVLQQVWRDANGKEVQIAATYSYVWLADQVGHVGLGMLVALLLDRVASASIATVWVAQLVAFGTVAAAVCGWEFTQYRVAVAPHDGPVQADKALIGRNAVVAALYMVLGVGAGWAVQLPLALMTCVITALSFVGVVAAKYWVKQKIIWQKAGLPYLSRLSDACQAGLRGKASTLHALIREADARPHQVVIAGPLGSGRTRLAAAVGTEFAFSNKTVRYLSLDRLIEFARAEPPPPPYGDDRGPSNIAYWPWTDAQVLIIDDVGPVLEVADATQLQALKKGLERVRPCLVEPHTVWVFGSFGSDRSTEVTLEHAADVIRDLCKGSLDPVTIPLRAGGCPPPPRASRRQRG